MLLIHVMNKPFAHGVSHMIYQARILELLRMRTPSKTLCPSEVLSGTDKQNKTLMQSVREAAFLLRDQGKIEVLQRGKIVKGQKLKGPIRLRLKKSRRQIPRRITHRSISRNPVDSSKFNYALPYKQLNLRHRPELYRVGVGEQGVLLVEPYKSEILPHWKFKTPQLAEHSSRALLRLFRGYKRSEDFIGMDMARKFLQMGFTRSRRYANRASGRKYAADGSLLPFANDEVKAASAKIFYQAWQQVEADTSYADLKIGWKILFG